MPNELERKLSDSDDTDVARAVHPSTSSSAITPSSANASNTLKRKIHDSDEAEDKIKALRLCTSAEEYATKPRNPKNLFHGFIYQIELLMLFILIGIEKGYKFKLATEYADGGSFDDLVFRFNRDDENGKELEEEYLFLQAKHQQLPKFNWQTRKKIMFDDLLREVINSKTKKPYAIHNYILSFKTIIEKSKFKDKTHDFIICTNSEIDVIDFKKNGITMKEVTTSDDFFLKHVNSKRCTLQVDENSTLFKELIDVFEVSVVKEFFEKFVFASSQPNDAQLIGLLNKRVGDHYYFNVNDASLITDSFEIEVLNWFKEKKGTWFTAERADEMFKSISERILNFVSIGHTKSYIKKLESYQMKFKFYNEIVDFVQSEKNIFNLISKDQSTLLGALRVHHALSNLKGKRDDFLMLDLSNLLNPTIRNPMLKSFQSKTNFNLLVIECNYDSGIRWEEAESICNTLHNIIEENLLKKLILISSNNDIFASALKTQSHMELAIYDEVVDSSNFADLTDESKNFLLKKENKFQGVKVQLIKIINNRGDEIIDNGTLVKIIKNEEIFTFDTKLRKPMKYNHRVYVKRSLEISEKRYEDYYNPPWHSDYEMQSQSESDAESVAQSDDESDTESVAQSDDESDTESVAQSDDESDAESQPELEPALEPAIDLESVPVQSNSHNTKTIMGEDIILPEINLNTNKVIEISAPAGHGKTILMNRLNSTLIEYYKFHYIFLVNLPQCCQLLNTKFELWNNDNITELMRNDKVNFVLQLIAASYRTKLSKFEENVIKSYFEDEVKIVFMFDGLDEISPDYEQIVINLLKILQQEAAVFIWIATRPNIKTNLRRELRALTLFIRPLNKEEQIKYLKDYFITCFNDSNEDRIACFANAVHKVFTNSFRCNVIKQSVGPRLIGSMLQIHMLAEILKKKFETFLLTEDESPTLPEKFSLGELYSEFMEKKRKLFCEDKCSDNFNIQNKRGHGHLLEKISKSLDYLAIKELFPNNYNRFIHNVEIHPSVTETGIVEVVNENHYHFVHITYPQHLAAKYFVKMLQQEAHPEGLKCMLDYYRGYIFDYLFAQFVDDLMINITITDSNLAMCGSILAKMKLIEHNYWERKESVFFNLMTFKFFNTFKFFIASLMKYETIQFKGKIYLGAILEMCYNCNDKIQFIDHLIDLGVNIHSEETDEKPILFYALHSLPSLKKLVPLLENRNVNLCDLTYEGRNILQECAQKLMDKEPILPRDDDAFFEYLFLSNESRKKWKIEIKFWKECVRHLNEDYFGVVKYLEEHISTVNHSQEWMDALDYFARAGGVEICKWLIEEKGVNHSDDILHKAVESGNLDLCMWLVETFDLKVVTDQIDNSPLQEAFEYKSYEILYWILNDPGFDFQKFGNGLLIEDLKHCDGKLGHWLERKGCEFDDDDYDDDDCDCVDDVDDIDHGDDNYVDDDADSDQQ